MQDKSESLSGRAAQIDTVLFETQTTWDSSWLFFLYQGKRFNLLALWKSSEYILTKRKTKRKREKEKKGGDFLPLIEDIFTTLIFYAHLIVLLTALEVK